MCRSATRTTHGREAVACGAGRQVPDDETCHFQQNILAWGTKIGKYVFSDTVACHFVFDDN